MDSNIYNTAITCLFKSFNTKKECRLNYEELSLHFFKAVRDVRLNRF